MKNGTSFLFAIITISFITQSGNILLDKTSFDKLFKVISGIIILIIITHFVSDIKVNNVEFLNKKLRFKTTVLYVVYAKLSAFI